MNHSEDILDYLDDMILNCRQARRFVSDMSFEEFQGDPKTVYAVIRELEIVGEAAKQIPMEIRSRYPHIPWREITGMGDKLIHAYGNINLWLSGNRLRRTCQSSNLTL